MAEQTYKRHEIPIYSVNFSQNFEDVKVRLLLNLYEISITS